MPRCTKRKKTRQVRRVSLKFVAFSTRLRLQGLNVLCLPALRAFLHIELDRLAFLQAAEATARLNRRKMHEDVFAILTADESETLGIVKPLHCSLFHCFVTFSIFEDSC